MMNNLNINSRKEMVLNMLLYVLSIIWEGFKTALALAFLVYAILFYFVGGEFLISIKWENAVTLWHLITK